MKTNTLTQLYPDFEKVREAIDQIYAAAGEDVVNVAVTSWPEYERGPNNYRLFVTLNQETKKTEEIF